MSSYTFDCETGEAAMVPLDPARAKATAAMQAAGAAAAKEAEQAAADRAALQAKLATGTASPAETQGALAELLDGAAPVSASL